MTARFAIPAGLILVSLAHAQPAPQLAPDQLAYADAGKITDPEKRIEALKQVKADFPDSISARLADAAIFSTLTQTMPEQTARLRSFAAEMYRGAPAKDRGSMANQIALGLLDRNLLLGDARRYARRAVDAQSLAGYIREQQEGYRKRRAAPPWTSELETRYRTLHAVRLATLGRIELKLGHTRRARRLLEEAYISNKSAIVEAALGELALRSGDEAGALRHWIVARLSGGAPKEANDALAALYRKQHGDSLDGFEAMLDREYRERYPNPLAEVVYVPNSGRSDRVVLAEVFTGAGCGPCVAADLAFDAAMARYSRGDLAVVMYHEHIPRPDPMTNPDTQAREKNYAVQGVPTFAIDGKRSLGGGGREQAGAAYARFNPEIERDLEMPAEAQLTARAALAGNKVHVTAAVDHVKRAAKVLKVQILLVEKQLRYTGENGIRFHPMVVRAMGGKDDSGFTLKGAGNESFEQTFDIDQVSSAIKQHLDAYEAAGHRGETFTFSEKKYQIDRSGLAVVVFVQDEESKHVLQSAYLDLGGQAGARPLTEVNQPQWRTLLTAGFLAIAVALAAPDPVTWRVEGAPAGPVKPGVPFRVRLVAKIEAGWHMYSMNPVAEGPIPTRLWLDGGQPFQLAGAIRASQTRTAGDAAFGTEVELYEDEATFTIPLQAVAAAPAGRQRAEVSVSFQSCDDKICLPPKTVKVDVAITIAR